MAVRIGFIYILFVILISFGNIGGCGGDEKDCTQHFGCEECFILSEGCLASQLAKRFCCESFLDLFDMEGNKVLDFPGVVTIPPLIRPGIEANPNCKAIDCQTLDCGGRGIFTELELNPFKGKVFIMNEQFHFEHSFTTCGVSIILKEN